MFFFVSGLERGFMGLDMYLYKAKKVKGAKAEDINKIDSYFDYLNRPKEYKDTSMEKWCGISKRNIRRSLIPYYESEVKITYSSWDTEKRWPRVSILENVMYWRKANQIHNYFVTYVQKGVDDCGIYRVYKHHLVDLLKRCKSIVHNCELVDGEVCVGISYKYGKPVKNLVKGKVMTNTEYINKVLPSTDGFFFGSTDYDEYYRRDLDDTILMLEHLLHTTDFKREVILYRSSW